VVVFTPFWEGANGALCVEVQTDPTNKFYLQKVARDNDDATLAEAAKGIVLLPHENKTLTMKVWLEAGKITVKDLQARELAAKASAASLVESASGTQDAANGGVSWNKIKVALNSKSGQFYFKRAFFTKDNLQGITVELNDQRTQKTIKQIIQEDGSAEN
jgi:hypothetical protein